MLKRPKPSSPKPEAESKGCPEARVLKLRVVQENFNVITRTSQDSVPWADWEYTTVRGDVVRSVVARAGAFSFRFPRIPGVCNTLKD